MRAKKILSHAIESLESRRLLTTFIVNSNADTIAADGQLTLREAITAANTNAPSGDAPAGEADTGPNPVVDRIEFAIGTGPATISLTSPLPFINENVTIDGSTQPGFVDRPTITLDGTNGTFPDQSAAINADSAVTIRSLAVRNIHAVDPKTEFVTAIELQDTNKSDAQSVVTGNDVIGNDNGIIAESESGFVVGGTSPADRNVVSGNLRFGIIATGDVTSQSHIEGNYIGVDEDGVTPLPNGGDGIYDGSSRGGDGTFYIGGSTPDAGNIIANNGGNGIVLFSLGVIRFNSIYSNGKLGIEKLKSNGPDQNDPQDSDSVNPGGNDLVSNFQNYPVLSSATRNADGTMTISGLINTNPSSPELLDFYASPDHDPSGYGEGKTHVASVTVVTDVNGNATFDVTVPAALAANSGDYISSTATSIADTYISETSEFSQTIKASPATTSTPPASIPPTISIGDVSMNEGNSGTTAFTFTITRSGDLSSGSSVQYATADGSATTADGDYQPATNTIGFDPNQATKTVTVLVNGDTNYEADETFTVNLSTPTGATLADAQATGTIVNDDPLPTISIGNVSMKEGNNGTTEFDFPLTFSDNGPFAQNISFVVTTADGTATVSDNDYQPVNGAGAAFIAGTNLSGKFLPVFVNGDAKVEGNETFTVTISSASGVTIANAVATGTIINDDSAPPPPPPPSSGSVSVITDPCDSTKKALEIDGTDNKDTITVTKSGSSQGKAVVKINGVNKGTFSFSGSIVVYGKGGNDNIAIDSGITRSAYIWGGDGNDTVSGGGGNDIIFGQGNDDSLNGNSGRDILVGGDGTDKLNGGSGDDLLIAGDFKSAPSMSQLCSIQKEWDRTDKSYSSRVKDLTSGGGFNSIKLNSSTLFSSTTLKDSMTGGADNDLFFAAMSGDKITDKSSSETTVNIG